MKTIGRLANNHLLHYSPQTQELLSKYLSAQTSRFDLPLQFFPTKQPSNFYNRLLVDRGIGKKFKELMSAIELSSAEHLNQVKVNFPNIEENLIEKIHSTLNQKSQKIQVLNCSVNKAHLIDQKKVYGLFFHRKLNLPRPCYSTEIVKDLQIRYRQKKKLARPEYLLARQKSMMIFEREKISQQLFDTYEGFQETEYFVRQVWKLFVDLKLEITTENYSKEPGSRQQVKQIDFQGQTEHILQVENYRMPYIEQVYCISDVDYFLNGNPYLSQ